ncbi:MAG: hypothetical protein ACK4TG_00985 [Thermaurantiacus sp.]
MPTVDGGHYFLTCLIPVETAPRARADGSITVPSHLLREELARLPLAQQSPETVASGRQSPFARCRRTHTIRFAVIDQPAFQGRDRQNVLLTVAKGDKPLEPRQSDALRNSWLLLSADLDARADEPDQGLASWAGGLWAVCEAELRAVFGTCVGFDRVSDGAGFAAWLKRCQIETWMSFNDYWPHGPRIQAETPRRLLFGGLATSLGVMALFWWWLGTSVWLVPLVLPAAAAAIGAVMLRLWQVGGRPFPAAPHGDLPSVLKALHVQQQFARFAEEAQGLSAGELHARFGAFLADVRPSDIASPTQPPGVIRSDGVPLVEHKEVLVEASVP